MKKIICSVIAAILLFSRISYASGLGIVKKYAASTQRVMTVMYHLISEDPQLRNTYCITPNELENDIIYLKKNNYIFASVSEMDKVCAENPKKNVAVLTFDDGYESDYKYVLPILEKHNAKATFFIVGSMLNSPFYLTDSQLKKLADSPYAEIGNHSYELHKKSPAELISVYSELSETENIILDFQKNKSVLEKITAKPVTALSYPNGIYTYFINDALKSRGICNITVSTNEIQCFPPLSDRVLGRFNRSNLRTAENISWLLK